MGQEEIKDLLKSKPKKWFSVNDILFNLKQEGENEDTLERSIRRSLLQLTIYKQINGKTEGFTRYYRYKENENTL